RDSGVFQRRKKRTKVPYGTVVHGEGITPMTERGEGMTARARTTLPALLVVLAVLAAGCGARVSHSTREAAAVAAGLRGARATDTGAAVGGASGDAALPGAASDAGTAAGSSAGAA